MTSLRMAQCALHPTVPATYRCDGCLRSLCDACVQEGHRLIFCTACGERALPLRSEQPATTPALQRHRRATAKDGLFAALAYPLRGAGAWQFGVFVVLISFLGFFANLPLVGLGAIILLLGMFGLLAGQVLCVLRRTAEGDDELPPWVGFDLGARSRDFFILLLAMAVGLTIPWLALKVTGCHFGVLLYGEEGIVCWLVFIAGLSVGTLLAMLTLGAAAVYGRVSFALRLDLHVRALGVLGFDLLRTVGFVVGLVLVLLAAKLFLADVRWFGSLLQTALSTYGLFTTAHLLGLLYRRHGETLDPLYLGDLADASSHT